MGDLTAQLRKIRKRFEDGDLTMEDIDAALAQAALAQAALAQAALAQAENAQAENAEGKHGPGNRRQGLLYLQAPSTNPHSAVVGISIYEDGADSDGLDENGEFRYRSIKEALDDGWRIVKFPETSLAMREQDNYGLGYEFVLERWR